MFNNLISYLTSVQSGTFSVFSVIVMIVATVITAILVIKGVMSLVKKDYAAGAVMILLGIFVFIAAYMYTAGAFGSLANTVGGGSFLSAG